MAIIRCPRGHYYDDRRFSHCPHCGIEDNLMQDFSAEGAGYEDQEDKTIAIHPGAGQSGSWQPGAGQSEADQPALFEAEEETTIALGLEAEPDLDDARTVSFYSGEKGNDYVVGWLVCVKGPELGRDYRLHYGFNRIGRSPQMDVILAEDPAISRDCHFAVVYDDKSNQFSLVPVGGNLIYRNGTLISEPVTMKSGDTVSAGASQFEFMAFCREGRVWEKE